MILGVGIYYHANLWPDHQAMFKGGFTNWSIWKILYYPYWQLYGEFNLDVLSGNAKYILKYKELSVDDSKHAL